MRYKDEQDRQGPSLLFPSLDRFSFVFLQKRVCQGAQQHQKQGPDRDLANVQPQEVK